MWFFVVPSSAAYVSIQGCLKPRRQDRTWFSNFVFLPGNTSNLQVWTEKLYKLYIKSSGPSWAPISNSPSFFLMHNLQTFTPGRTEIVNNLRTNLTTEKDRTVASYFTKLIRKGLAILKLTIRYTRKFCFRLDIFLLRLIHFCLEQVFCAFFVSRYWNENKW